MVLAAETLTVLRIERRAAIFSLDDVIGKHPPLSATAARAGFNPFAPAAGALNYDAAPRAMLLGEELGICLLCCWLRAARIEHCNAWWKAC